MLLSTLLLTGTQALSLCEVVTKACKIAVPAGGVSGFLGCTGASALIAGACEVAGLGPENPLSDICAVGLGLKFEGSCLAASWSGAGFTAAACANMMLCAWHPDEPKRPNDPFPPIPGPQDPLGCVCNPVSWTCQPSEEQCSIFHNQHCNPANGHADCESYRRITGSFEEDVVQVAETNMAAPDLTTLPAPNQPSPVVGGKGSAKKGKKDHRRHHLPEACAEEEDETPIRPPELRDDRRRFEVNGQHCYCDEWCTYYLDCCPDCHHDHTDDPCTQQHTSYGQAACNNPSYCSEPAICGACSYDHGSNYCFTAPNEDPCTLQHGPPGQAFCNDNWYCGAPGFCQFCAYDWSSDHCYTPTETTPTCSGHYQCWGALAGCEGFANKDACLYRNHLTGFDAIGECGNCLEENYGVFGTRAALENHPESHDAYCLSWDCAEEFKYCYDSYHNTFPWWHHTENDDYYDTIYVCAQDMASTWADSQCTTCLGQYAPVAGVASVVGSAMDIIINPIPGIPLPGNPFPIPTFPMPSFPGLGGLGRRLDQE